MKQLIGSNQLRSRKPPATEEQPDDSENSIQELPSKPRSRSQKPESIRGDKSKERGKMEAVADKSGNAIERLKSRGGKQSEKESKDEAMQLEDGELEEDELPDEGDTKVQEVRPSPTKGHDRHQMHDSDVEGVPPLVTKSHSEKPPSKVQKGKESGAKDDNSSKKRGRSKPPSTISGQNQSEVDTEEEPAKKKKRKLNVTSGHLGAASSVFGGPAGFTWNQVSSTYFSLFPLRDANTTGWW